MDSWSPTPEGAVTRRLPFEVASVRAARGLVTSELEARGAGARAIEDANLVVGELVMNGICHGRPTADHELEISWWPAPGALGFSVLDGGQVDLLTARMPAAGDAGGRGLAIVTALASSWTYDSRRGTRVSAELRIRDED